ncbi:AlbA family DNA-binding domain-containing protein [Roseivirga echinicomitans]|uniref:Transcriptional regulator n=1 Tax=Roseivirga echinicomitans TaxID=296218 RepID=A0A150XYJ6_9BACT|nr:helix-turn-helix domain-containing protein [Roseivirga echinicomitans]KYG83724.1 hypothetical protein AWN68_02650 [Roseivirga echinicomitans]
MTKAELQLILQEGEGYRAEFKSSLNSDLQRELVAFANGSGGRVFLGVSDDGKVTGIEATNHLRSQIQQAASTCDPPVDIKLETFENILIIEVKEGHDKPYRCTKGFFLRAGSSSEKMNTAQIIKFVQSEGRIKFDELLFKKYPFEEIFDSEKLNHFLSLKNISKSIEDADILSNLGVLEFVDDQAYLTHTGVLFFTKTPTKYIPHSNVVCARFQGNDKATILDKKELSGDLISNIEGAILFLKTHLKNRVEISGTRRMEILEIPEVVLREAIVNAIAHRDYFEKGANVMVEVFDDMIEISNPGGLPKGLSEKDFGKKSLARNPNICALLNQANYIEKMGTGISRMRKLMQKGNLPEIQFEYSEFFSLRFSRISGLDLLRNELGVISKRASKLRFIMKELAEAEAFSVNTLSEKLELSSRAIRDDLQILVEHGYVNMIGETKDRVYTLTSKGVQFLKADN